MTDWRMDSLVPAIIATLVDNNRVDSAKVEYAAMVAGDPERSTK